MHWCLDDLSQLHDLLNVLEEKDDVSSFQNIEEISPTIPITVQQQLACTNFDEVFPRGTLSALPPSSPPPLISLEPRKQYNQYVIKSGKMFSYGTSRNTENVTSDQMNASCPMWQPFYGDRFCDPLLQSVNTTIDSPLQPMKTVFAYDKYILQRKAAPTLTSNTATTTETKPLVTIVNSSFNNGQLYQASMNAALTDPPPLSYINWPNRMSSSEPIMKPLKWNKPIVLSSMPTTSSTRMPMPSLTPRPNLCQKLNILSPRKRGTENLISLDMPSLPLHPVPVKPPRKIYKYVKTKHMGEIKLEFCENADKDWYILFYRTYENKLWCETMKPRRGLRAGRQGKKPVVTNYECMLCEDVLSCFQSLMSHLNLHLHLTPFMCYMCEKSYASAASLSRHVRNKHGITKRKAK